MGPGTNIFNESLDNPDARQGLGGNAPLDRVSTADLRFTAKGDVQTNYTRGQKLARCFIQEKRTSLFRRKGLQSFSRETIKRNCILKRIAV